MQDDDDLHRHGRAADPLRANPDGSVISDRFFRPPTRRDLKSFEPSRETVLPPPPPTKESILSRRNQRRSKTVKRSAPKW